MTYVQKASLKAHPRLVEFIEERCLPGAGLSRDEFWSGFSDIVQRFTPENKALLQKRRDLQSQIDEWHADHRDEFDQGDYIWFLKAIGYLTEEIEPFKIASRNIDDELAQMAGPQLVVPARNARFALNAANARWGSLYDALYGTDVIPGDAAGGGYNPARGAKVVNWAKQFLDKAAPLKSGTHKDVDAYRIDDSELTPALKDPSQFAGYSGDPDAPTAILLRNNGLHIELVIDRARPVGRDDAAGVCDVVLEAALSTIVDLEDSVAAVDVEDKIEAYANWLGLIDGSLSARLEKSGKQLTRTLHEDRVYTAPDGERLCLHGRSLLLVRNVGHLMTTPAVLDAEGGEIFEGVLDGVLTAMIGAKDLRGEGAFQNSRAGSVYIVKPKMHGPEEAAFTDRLFSAIEELLRLAPNTLKIGVMDEERRTSANLAACIKAVANRIFFINTGFLDRTGDEIHTSMQAGAVAPKGDMKNTAWINAYEERNVLIGLACGFSGRAQIGKGMWAAPDRMADMLEQKIQHPKTGANTAWVPSPTAATLHATHYHRVDVFARQHELAAKPIPSVETLLTLPLAAQDKLSPEKISDELDNNIQGILGYVVRWIDQGVGCSKVPDINDIGLMEDRATLRISSQHVANWLRWGVCTAQEVDAVYLKMAAKVDAQNVGDPLYEQMAPDCDASLAFQAARALVFEGETAPNGYTEPTLHKFRIKKKALQE